MPDRTVPLTPVYQGSAVLETMEEARNYNAWLAALVLRNAAGARRVLDFGAGQGSTAAAVADAGFDVECLEPDARLRQHISVMGLPVFEDLPTDHRYDFIYSLNVLEHIERDDVQLRLLRRALHQEGRLLLYVPAFMCLYSGFDRLVGHHRRYTKAHLCDRLTAAGFSIDHAAYVDCLGFFAGLAYRMIGPRDGSLGRSGLIAYDRAVFPISRRLDRIFGGAFGKNLIVTARPR